MLTLDTTYLLLHHVSSLFRIGQWPTRVSNVATLAPQSGQTRLEPTLIPSPPPATHSHRQSEKKLWTVQLSFSKEETTLKQVLRIPTKIYIYIYIVSIYIYIMDSSPPHHWFFSAWLYTPSAPTPTIPLLLEQDHPVSLSDGCPSGCHQNRKPIGSNKELRGRFWQCKCLLFILFTIDLPQYIPGIC